MAIWINSQPFVFPKLMAFSPKNFNFCQFWLKNDNISHQNLDLV